MLKNSFYRFELVRGSRVIDAFNLVLPPQTLSYDGGYRDNVQKTFGGTHLDIMGMDNEVIKLSGTVGGRRNRSGWSNITATELTGVEALKYFRDNIWRYPANSRYKMFWRELTVKFYDIDLDDVRWVNIDSVSISRDKSAPFWYNFAITLIDIGEPSKIQNVTNKLQETLSNYKNKLQGIMNTAQEIQDKILGPVELAESYVDTALGFSDETVRLGTALIAQTRSVFNTILTIPERLGSRIGDSIVEVANLVLQIAGFVTEDVRFVGEYGKYLQSVWEDIGQDALVLNNAFKQMQKKSTVDAVKSGELQYLSDSVQQSTIDQIINTTRQVVVQGDKTVEQLANELYNDAAMADVIMELNGLESIFIPNGTILQIPVYEEQDLIPDNLVISQTNEPLGSDVQLDEVSNSIIPSASGDLSLVGNVDNISQLVRDILRTDIGTVLSDPTFGFQRDLLGGGLTENASKLVGVKIKEALLRDPRIADIADFEYRIDKSAAYVQGRIILRTTSQSALVSETIPIA